MKCAHTRSQLWFVRRNEHSEGDTKSAVSVTNVHTHVAFVIQHTIFIFKLPLQILFISDPFYNVSIVYIALTHVGSQFLYFLYNKNNVHFLPHIHLIHDNPCPLTALLQPVNPSVITKHQRLHVCSLFNFYFILLVVCLPVVGRSPLFLL